MKKNVSIHSLLVYPNSGFLHGIAIHAVFISLISLFSLPVFSQCEAGDEAFGWNNTVPSPWDESANSTATFSTSNCSVTVGYEISIEDPDGVLNTASTGAQVDGRYQLAMSNPSAGDEVRVRISFSEPIALHSFRIDDIDDNGSFQDIVEVSATTGADVVPLSPSMVGGSASYTINGQRMTADSNNPSNTDDLGAVWINSSIKFDGIVITLRAGSNYGGSDQGIYIHGLTMCCPLDTDGDGVSDANDIDDDNDGIPDTVEQNPCSLGENKIVNGSFENGYVGFATDPTFSQNTSCDNICANGWQFSPLEYRIDDQACDCSATKRWRRSAQEGRYFLLIDFPPSGTKSLYQQTVDVLPETRYEFAAWIANLDSAFVGNEQSDPSLQLSVIENGSVVTILGSGISATESNGWIETAYTYVTGATASTLTILVENYNVGSNGNDAGIDNIQLREVICDMDGDGVPNHLDLDADNDGIPDIIEADGVDVNGDGIVDDLTDTDGDGLVDIYDDDCDLDTGGNAVAHIHNGVDDPDDALGVPGTTYAKVGNGEYIELDMGKVVSAGTTIDLYLARTSNKTNSTNQEISQAVNSGGPYSNAQTYSSTQNTTVGAEIFSYTLTADARYIRVRRLSRSAALYGLAYGGIASPCLSSGIPLTYKDTDSDGIVDCLDLDADGDGIPDLVEAGGVDHNGDGLVDDLNAFDILTFDLDDDGFTDWYDPDNDGIFGVDTGDEDQPLVKTDGTGTMQNGESGKSIDRDGDGFANHLDLDADGDGIPDLIENGGVDSEGNGRVDNATDIDGDDFGGDGLADIYDSDDDSVPGVDDPNDALVQTGGVDTDNDRKADDAAITYVSGTSSILPDFDGDRIINSHDLDTDNDGILDVVEAGATDVNQDGFADGSTDVDGDGLLDTYDSDASDGPAANGSNGTPLFVATSDDTDPNTRFEYVDGQGTGDSDGDDVPDFRDVDADNDGIFDIYESQATLNFTPLSGTDTDCDGIDNVFDDDDVNIGGAGAAGTTPYDMDSDDIPDYLAADTDGDGVPDIQEAWDALDDGDSRPDGVAYEDCFVDTDGDGLVDAFDSDDTNLGIWTSITPPDDDGTGGATTSVGIDISASQDADDIFPNNALGSNANEPDWRDVGNAACPTAITLYAMTDPGTSYEYNKGTQKHESGIATGVIRATAVCGPTDGWYRFYNPLEPDNYLFAIQNNSNTINLADAIDYIEIEVESTPVVNKGPDHGFVVMARSWKIETKQSLNGSVNIRFYFTPGEYSDFSDASDDLLGSYLDGELYGEWFKVDSGLDYGAVPNNPTTYDSDNYVDMTAFLSGSSSGQADGTSSGNMKKYAQFNNLSSFSGGTLGAETFGTLPVEWLDFSAQQKDNDGLVSWSTLSEIQADYFSIERSVDGVIFQEMGREPATGSSGEIAAYQFLDANITQLSEKQIFYRMRQVDINGAYDVSNIVELKISTAKTVIRLKGVPIPASDYFTVKYGMNVEDEGQLEILNPIGSQVFKRGVFDPSGQIKIPVSQWAPGIYYLRFLVKDNQKVVKFQVNP